MRAVAGRGGAPVAGLEDTRLHRRTAVATDGKSQWAIITTGAVTMADAARILSLKDLPGAWSIVDALNLDGGGVDLPSGPGGRAKFFDIRSFGPVRKLPSHRPPTEVNFSHTLPSRACARSA